jgi:GNAT superfamily N-acetyltransferase
VERTTLEKKLGRGAMKIVSAKPKHRKELQRMFYSLNSLVQVHLKYTDLEAIDEAIKKHQIKIAFEGTKSLGTIVLVSRKHSIYIGALVVRARSRRKGVGKKLVREAIKKGRRQLKKHISVATAFGYDARGFYERCGFYRTRTWSDAWSLSYRLKYG